MNNRLELQPTPLSDLMVIQRLPLEDSRGYLERLFCAQELEVHLPPGRRIEQVNHTLTHKRGTVRGLHFQSPPHAELKVVTCLKGAVYDVALDLRRTSPTFLRWHAEVLSDMNHRSLLIPEGFAHGFQTMTADAELLYLHTAAYDASHEGGLDALDRRLNVAWPEPLSERSERDMGYLPITDTYAGLEL